MMACGVKTSVTGDSPPVQRTRSLLALGLLVLATGPALTQRATVRPSAPPPTDLFRQTNISTVDLEFAKADYDALAPRGAGWFGGGGGGGSAQSWLQGP